MEVSSAAAVEAAVVVQTSGLMVETRAVPAAAAVGQSAERQEPIIVAQRLRVPALLVEMAQSDAGPQEQVVQEAQPVSEVTEVLPAPSTMSITTTIAQAAAAAAARLDTPAVRAEAVTQRGARAELRVTT